MNSPQSIRVKGMHCQHCAQSVTQALENVPEVHDVSVDLSSGEVTFETSGPVDKDTLRSAIEAIGFDMEE
ncbi:mercury transporter [Oceanidesulfovibrio indonesiensis]|uniref:Mercury transporter n=1 Tax=Oceanidesulfovibrio indonesiensis TaxID=54767 RepID=A0A7M3MEB0_9BACT|nr:heavy metal-associated domain-containing protein [Oceanidesulfovibrio indonesiensis]TVM17160.1 mercury transporter [Oceanidesulfovibrio indonesiensis]